MALTIASHQSGRLLMREKPKHRQLVALVDWNTVGHHFTWYRAFCRALLEMGCQVAAFSPDPDHIKSNLVTCLEPEALDRVLFFKLNLSNPPQLLPARIGSILQARSFASVFRRALTKMEQDFGKSVDLVFLACLYEFEEYILQKIVNVVQRPWSGLLVHARSLDLSRRIILENLLTHPRLSSIAIVDESMTQVVESTVGKPVFVFPDLTDEAYETEHPLEKRFRRFACGDKLISAIGHVRQNKGLGTLAQLALDPAAKGLAFAFAGELVWDALDAKTREPLERAMGSSPNAIFHTKHISDGAAYNAVVRASDVLFAAYRNFPHSSNLLTKAAVFEKPVIVSDGYVMARRVREYRMGEVVAADDPKATIVAIRRITNNYSAWLQSNQPDWRQYRSMHSYTVLTTVFSEMIDHCRSKEGAM